MAQVPIDDFHHTGQTRTPLFLLLKSLVLEANRGCNQGKKSETFYELWINRLEIRDVFLDATNLMPPLWRVLPRSISLLGVKLTSIQKRIVSFHLIAKRHANQTITPQVA